MNIRKNAATLTTAEKKAFRTALLGVKHKPSRLHPTDPTRSRYDDFVQVHLDAMMVMMHQPVQTSWGHQAAAFGPWHRVLLLEFEKELQAIVPSVTLPYWDWPNTGSATSVLWKDDFLGSNGGGPDQKVGSGDFSESAGQWPIVVKDDPADASFLRRNIGGRSDARNVPTAAQQSAVMSRTPYDLSPWEDTARNRNTPAQWRAFRIELEIDLHNLVHRWVGGNMLDMASPNDPVFWLHHANCDRLWSQWQIAHTGPTAYLPTSGGPTGHNLHDAMIFSEPATGGHTGMGGGMGGHGGHSGGGGTTAPTTPWTKVYRPIDVLDSQLQLNVRYDSEAVRTTPFPQPPAPPPGGHRDVDRGGTHEYHVLPMFVLRDEIPAMREQERER